MAQALQVALPTRSGLVRPSALHRLSEEFSGVLAQGQDRRLAGNVRQGDGAQLLDQDDGQERQVRWKKKIWFVVVDRDGEEVTLRPKHLVFATGMSSKPNEPRFKGMA